MFDSRKKVEAFPEDYRCRSPYAFVGKYTKVNDIFREGESRVTLHGIIQIPQEERGQYSAGDSILIFPKTIVDASVMEFCRDLGVEELDNQIIIHHSKFP